MKLLPFVALSTIILAVSFVACSLIGQKPPTRAQVEASEDKFCKAVSEVRQAEALAATLNSSEAPATAVGGSPTGK